MIAKYPNNCCVCGEQFIPRETEIEQHPTMRGPRGGKQYCHVDCMPRSNPRGRVRRNSGCGCGYGSDCGCGGYRSNPKGAEHRELMKLSRMGVVNEQAMRSAAADEAIAEYQAERASGGRSRRR
jgi:hypothetical protein